MHMSNAALDWAFAMPIRGAEKAVLIALANRASPETQECHPMQSTLALESGISERSVRAALDRLQEAGLIRADRKQGRISRYYLNMETGSKSEPGSGLNGKTEPEASSYISEASSGRNGKLVPIKPEAASEEPKRTQKRTQREPKTGARASEGFDVFWSAYPRKVGKGQAERAWRTAVKKASADQITASMLAYPFDRDRPEYIPHASTWLNGERWLDRIEAPRRRFQNGFLELIRRDQAGETPIAVDNPVAEFLRLPHVH